MESQIIEIVSFDKNIEEEVLVTNGKLNLLCFAGNLPLTEVGDEWLVELNLFVAHEYEISELDEFVEEAIVQFSTGYQHMISGRLVDGQLLSCGYSFSNNALQSDYLYLDGSIISMKVDRIDIDFLGKQKGTMNSL